MMISSEASGSNTRSSYRSMIPHPTRDTRMILRIVPHTSRTVIPAMNTLDDRSSIPGWLRGALCSYFLIVYPYAFLLIPFAFIAALRAFCLAFAALLDRIFRISVPMQWYLASSIVSNPASQTGQCAYQNPNRTLTRSVCCCLIFERSLSSCNRVCAIAIR